MGKSWQVVPEAFLYKPDKFTEVHCITTSSTQVNPDQVIEFFQGYPEVQFTLSRLADFTDLLTNEDHQRFEETLFRWYLMHLVRAQELPLVCLAGGYKSMSAALWKAAGLFGATEIFHVLAEPKTLDAIKATAADGKLNFVPLGCEPGWSRLRTLDPKRFPLEQHKAGDGPLVTVKVDDYGLSTLIRESLDVISRRAEAWDRAADLLFSALALWQPRDTNWLRTALDPDTDADWVHLLPKIELHCHLGGFATHGDLLEQVRSAAMEKSTPWPKPPSLPNEWPWPQTPIPLDRYMHLGDGTGSSLLKDPGCLTKQIELLYQHLLNDRVIYAEIRCSPNNYSAEDRSAWQVLEQIRTTFQRCMDQARESGEGFCQVNLIIIATRKQEGDLLDISRHLALAITSAQHIYEPGLCRVVGVDLAGHEAVETRAGYFASEFTAIHR
jgi:adenosine deaminase